MSYQKHRGVRGRGKLFNPRNHDENRENNQDSLAEKGHTSILNHANLSDQRKYFQNISKHDNNCCRDIKIVLTLSEADNDFFQELKTMYQMCKYLILII